MAKKKIFRGIGTALITPLRDGVIDYTALNNIIDEQIEAGVDAIIIGGTTAEAATLTDGERYQLFAYAKAAIASRCKLIFGTGTNDTRLAVEHTKRASKIGCDGVLCVTPYYNKGTESGIVKHYLQIAECSEVPVLLYNVPSRTGVNLSIDTVRELAKHENIVGIKEALDSHDRLISLREIGDDFALYAGNDTAAYSVLSLGGDGVISVFSNAYPKYAVRLAKDFFAGRREVSLNMQIKALPMIRAMFLETNPSPIKYLMYSMGLCNPDVRLPLDLPTEKTRRELERCRALLEN